MTKTVLAALLTEFGKEAFVPATRWKITRQDGQIFYLTDHDEDLVIGGDTYKSAVGYERSAVATNDALAVDNVNVFGIIESTDISEGDLRAGLFDHASVEIAAVNAENTAQGEVPLRAGWIGEIKINQDGSYSAELRGLTQTIAQKIGEIYQPECRADLGDTRCKFPIDPDDRQDSTQYDVGDFIKVKTQSPLQNDRTDYELRIYECTDEGVSASSPPTYDTIVGNTTTDGGAIFTCRLAFWGVGTVSTVVDQRVFDTSLSGFSDDDFNGGVLTWESGNNSGQTGEVKDYVSSGGRISMFEPEPFTIQVGDKFWAFRGCRKRFTADCRDKFTIPGSRDFSTTGNTDNFRGEPFVPGTEAVLRVRRAV